MKIVNYGQRSNSIESFLKKYGIKSILEAKEFCLSHGVDCEKIVRGIQPIAFDDAVDAYTLGACASIKQGIKNAKDVCLMLGEALQAFCIPGSVADTR